MSIRGLTTELVEKWPAYAAKKKVSKSERAYEIVVDELPGYLAQQQSHPNPYVIEGSTGRGNITPTPWIATLDSRITTSATKGIYVVYLFSIDWKRVYLSIAFGVTEFSKLFGSGEKCLVRLQKAGEAVRGMVSADSRFSVGSIDLAAASTKLHKRYERSAIYHIPYELGSLPAEAKLVDDYLSVLDLWGCPVRC